jgi:hypothetical protein
LNTFISSGEYLGTQNPQCEYLYDEPDIEEVYIFEIVEVNPKFIVGDRVRFTNVFGDGTIVKVIDETAGKYLVRIRKSAYKQTHTNQRMEFIARDLILEYGNYFQN